VGRTGVEELLRVAADPGDGRVPEVARVCIGAGRHPERRE
jgi:hypothetical protein